MFLRCILRQAHIFLLIKICNAKPSFIKKILIGTEKFFLNLIAIDNPNMLAADYPRLNE